MLSSRLMQAAYTMQQRRVFPRDQSLTRSLLTGQPTCCRNMHAAVHDGDSVGPALVPLHKKCVLA